MCDADVLMANLCLETPAQQMRFDLALHFDKMVCFSHGARHRRVQRTVQLIAGIEARTTNTNCHVEDVAPTFAHMNRQDAGR